MNDICPASGLQPDFQMDAAAPSPDGDLILLLGSHYVLESFDQWLGCRMRVTSGL
jgi:hypothetical protein